MFNVYAQENEEKRLANSFENEIIASLYKAYAENYVQENYHTRVISFTIVEE